MLCILNGCKSFGILVYRLLWSRNQLQVSLYDRFLTSFLRHLPRRVLYYPYQLKRYKNNIIPANKSNLCGKFMWILTNSHPVDLCILEMPAIMGRPVLFGARFRLGLLARIIYIHVPKSNLIDRDTDHIII